MPKRNDIHKILIIGSGPIIIGQACEFDYSGTQACKALKSLGYEIVLANSNPATIMTDPETADITYVEPLNIKRLTEIIKKERPDAVLPNLGGQSGLNLCSELAEAGVLKQYGVKVIGVDLETIQRGEDRIAFKEQMAALGVAMPKSEPAYSLDEAKKIVKQLGYPCVIRPAYTMGGSGSGHVHNDEELETIVSRGISASMVGQVLVEESITGWEELELEVIRDAKGNMITVCFIENIDPLGVHTGDSFCSAPMLSISEAVQKRLQDYAYRIVDSIGVVGGTNVQFAHDPETDRIVVIEINPRTSRSSALASKATGFPIALISAMLAAGLTLDEIPYYKGGFLSDYKPSGEYVVIKFARWAFEKFKGAQDILGTQMKAVGEVMSIGKTYKEAFQKAIRSLETGRYGLGYAKDFHEKTLEELLALLAQPSSERQFILYEAIRKGAGLETLYELTKIKHYFLTQMQELVALEEKIKQFTIQTLPDDLLRQAKLDGFADRYLSTLLSCEETAVVGKRQALGITESWEAIPVSGVADGAYYYSTYHPLKEAFVPRSKKEKVMILGGGPNRIGQGIEFDYCCVHAAFTLRKLGYETIMVNCNPETVSTDYDTSDRLYFEPLTVEDVLSIYQNEKPIGVIAQFGGQTPLNLAAQLKKLGVHILGTSPETIDQAEDREHFGNMMNRLGIPMPPSRTVGSMQEALQAAETIGYPLMVRPSYVLGGAGMRVVYDEDGLQDYMKNITADNPVLIDKFLDNALEVEADAISDGKSAFVPAVIEHIEKAGIHSGDSACIIPAVHIPEKHEKTIEAYTEKIAVAMGVKGLMNIQYAIMDNRVYILEANPRASRTVPLVSKVCNIKMVPVATEIIMGGEVGLAGMQRGSIPYYGVKEAVFPFNMFAEVDPVLGPEMLSTGEVLGMDVHYGQAFLKAQEGAGYPLPEAGKVFLSVSRKDRKELESIARGLFQAGYEIIATQGTAIQLKEWGIPAETVLKLHEGSDEILQLIHGRTVRFIINTPQRKQADTKDDSYIRKAAIKNKAPYFTTLAEAKVAVTGLLEGKTQPAGTIQSLQEYHRQIR